WGRGGGGGGGGEAAQGGFPPGGRRSDRSAPAAGGTAPPRAGKLAARDPLRGRRAPRNRQAGRDGRASRAGGLARNCGERTLASAAGHLRPLRRAARDRAPVGQRDVRRPPRSSHATCAARVGKRVSRSARSEALPCDRPLSTARSGGLSRVDDRPPSARA